MSVFPGNPEPGLTDAELRASPVPVVISGGGSTTGGLTNNELRASPVSVISALASSASVTTFSSTSSSQILGSNANRKSVTIFNSTPNVLYVLLGSGTASSSNYSFALGEKELLSLSGITTSIQGIYTTSGTAYITELT